MTKKLMRYLSSFNDQRTLRKDLRIRGYYKAISTKMSLPSFILQSSFHKEEREFRYEEKLRKGRNSEISTNIL